VRRTVIVGLLALAWATAAAPARAGSERIAALQVALRAQGLYRGAVDGVPGPLTHAAVLDLQRRRGLDPDGKVGPQTRRALGVLGVPLLGRRELRAGLVGWDVSALEFRLRPYGLPREAIDGRFDERTTLALRRFQRSAGIAADGIAGVQTYRALLRAGRPAPLYMVQPGDSFFSIAQRFRTSPWLLAQRNDLRLDGVIVPGQRLLLPAGSAGSPQPPGEDRASVRAALDHWAGVYGVDPRLARALAWMESGFQNHVVSAAGARGVMQLLPETWDFVEVVLLGGERVPGSAWGNVRVGVRFLRWQLDHFGGDVSLALAGWYQGARAVRERGLYEDTKQFVSIVLALYGRV
jgi:hypothetical protein